MVARLELGDARADLGDDAGALVPENGGQRQRDVLVADRKVGVAHAGGDDLDDHLVGLRLAELDGLERECAVFLTAYRSLDLHGRPPLLDVLIPDNSRRGVAELVCIG